MRLREIPTGAVGPTSAVLLTWLGQAGFVIRAGELTVVIDPYLSDSLAEKYRGRLYPHVRLAPPPVAPGDLTDADVVLCTHQHTDHMDPDTLVPLAEVSTCQFVVPAAWVERVVGFGIAADRVIGAEDGTAVHLGKLRIDPVLAAHEAIERDDVGHSLYLGYVLSLGATVFYHSGDCIPYPGQVDALRHLQVDVALLPVNGRDETRASNGIPGNFHPHEASALARELGAKTLVAHHFGMFEFNTVDQRALDRAVAELPAHISFTQPTIGSTYEVDAHA